MKTFNKEEIEQLISTADIEELKKLVEEKNKFLRKTGLSSTFSFSFSEDLHYLTNVIKIIKKTENETLTKEELEDPNRFLKFETNSEIGIIAVNPFLNISKKLSREDLIKGFHKNVLIVTESMFREIVDKNFNVKTYDTEKAIDNIEAILANAIESNATDIYIKVNEKIGIIQFRIDNIVINQKETLSREQSESLKVSLAENANQDSRKVTEIKGKLERVIKGKKKEFRVSIMTVNEGFHIVIRVLAELDKNLTLSKLGYLPDAVKAIETMFSGTGLIFLAGVTGSGKTTTLAVAMRDFFNKTNAKIITMEDPVEIKNPNFVQKDMSEDGDERYKVDFAGTIKTALRQKPDMLMVGETRDFESAEACINAALSGHTTVSTMHSSSTRSSVARLLKLGIQEQDLNDCLSGIVSQMLVPKLCSCKILDEEAINEFCEENNIEDKDSIKIYKRNEQGCVACKRGKAGIKGMSNVYEIAYFKNFYNGDYKDILNATKVFIPMLKTLNDKLLLGEIDYKDYLKIKNDFN